MNKESKVKLEISVRAAAAVRQILFEHQKGYTTGNSVPERIFEIREIITDIDDSIEKVIKK